MTVQYNNGNAFEGNGDAVVVTVNCVGAMGRGIALECKLRMPWLYKAYRQACFRGKLRPGRIITPWCLYEGKGVKLHSGHEAVVLFPTKGHWRNPSELGWVESGLKDLVELAERQEWSVVDMTLPGTANGWIKEVDAVKDLCGEILGTSSVLFQVWFLDTL